MLLCKCLLNIIALINGRYISTEALVWYRCYKVKGFKLIVILIFESLVPEDMYHSGFV